MMQRLCVLVIGVCYCGLVSAAEYPVKVSDTNPRIMVDQNNVPFLMVGDSPHSLLANLSVADTASYLADRKANGFNSLWVELLTGPYTAGRPDGSLLNGTLPFTNTIPGTTNYDLTTPNEAYFAYVDQVIRMAATNGIEVLLDPIDTAGWLQTARDNGVSRCRTYGQYLGNRYKDFPNLIWMNGNDFQTWTIPGDDAVFTAVALGIKDEDGNHLQSVELEYFASSSLDDPNWAPIVGLNMAYTYYPTYAEVLHAYNQSTNMPVFMGEAYYDLEVNDAGPGEQGTPGVLRRQEYWTMLSGAAGQMYGNDYVWQFKSGWQTHLDTTGVTQLQYMAGFFSSRAWYNLVPDTNHTVVTSGYGTFENNTGTIGADTYLTAASTPDGTLAIAYTPKLQTFKVNLATFSGTVTARWFDPGNGTYGAISGSPFANTGTHNFTPPGNNSVGDTDWVLVLETVANPLRILTASLPSATVGVPYSSQILATGGSPPYSWSLTYDSPPGLTFSTSGLLSGLPTTGGGFTVAAQVLDSTNAFASENFALSVSLPDTTPPSTPLGLSAVVASSSQINVNWSASTDNVGVTGYVVERSQGTGSTAFAPVGTPTGTTFSDTGLSPSTVYNYQVAATDAAGNLSGYSSVASTTTTSNMPSSAGLAAAYGFNEGSGTAVTDASGNGDPGTISGATWTTAGEYGDALSFNGTSSYVNLGNPASLKLTGSMTVEAWVRATGNPPDDGSIVAKSGDSASLFGWQFKTTPDTGVRTFGIGVSPDGNLITQRYSKTVLSLNTWYHVAGVYNASAQTLDIYVNGVLDDGTLSGTVPSSQYDPNTNVTIGKRTSGFYFKGTIDDVRIYHSALSQAQIQTDMNTPVGSSPAADTTAPGVPGKLVASAVSSSQINVNWSASTDNVGVTGYLVERSQGAGSTAFVQVGTPGGTTFNDTGLAAGTVYNYRVRATDAAGNLSGYSSVASTTTLTASDTTAPTVPAGVSATAVSSSQINVNWQASTDNVGVTGYLVERSQGPASAVFAQVGTAAGTTFNDTGLTAGAVYNYRVRATDAAGNLSGYSSVASVATAPDTTVPSVPSGLVASFVSSNQVTLSWMSSTDNVGVTAYLIIRDGTLVAALPSTATNYTDVGLSVSTAYVYNVEAEDAAGNISSPASISVTTTTNITPVAVVRLNAGGGAFVDSAGNTWSADFGFNTGNTDSVSAAIAGTVDDVLYQSERWDPASAPELAYSFNLPNGNYMVNLHFAEIYPGTFGVGKRVFNVYLEGQMRLTNFDIYSMVGADTALIISLPVTVNDGQLNISFGHIVENPKISAIEVLALQTTPDTTVPSVPGNLVASAVGSSQISLSWQASTDDVGVTGYLVERSQGAGSTTFMQVGTPGGTAFNDTGLSAGTIYNYRVRATDAAGNLSGYSSVASVTTPSAPDTTPPSVPAGLSASAVSSSQINLSWTASTDNVGVTGYLVQRRQGSRGSFVQIATPAGTTFSDTGLSSRTSYSYRLRATDAAGNLSGYTSVVSATTTR